MEFIREGCALEVNAPEVELLEARVVMARTWAQEAALQLHQIVTAESFPLIQSLLRVTLPPPHPHTHIHTPPKFYMGVLISWY